MTRVTQHIYYNVENNTCQPEEADMSNRSAFLGGAKPTTTKSPQKKSFARSVSHNPTVIILGYQVQKGVIEMAQNLLKQPSQNSMSSFWDMPELKLSDEEYRLRINSVSPGDPAFLLYTSGSTAAPKGVLVTHNSVINFGIFMFNRFQPCIETTTVAVANPSDDVMLTALGVCMPLIHSEKTNIIIIPSFTSSEHYDKYLKDLVNFLEDNRITHFLRRTYDALRLATADNLNDSDLSSVKAVSVGGQVTAPEIREKIYRRFRESMIDYGSCEAPFVVCTSQRLSSYDQRLSSVGYPLPNVEVKIIDKDGVVLPINEAGEICVRSVLNFCGYLNNPEETKKKMKDSWIYMGDIGKMDETGHITFISRKDDNLFYKHYGEIVSPVLIEETLSRLPDICESKVIGIPDSLKGDDLFAFFVAKEESSISENKVMAYLRSKMYVIRKTDIFSGYIVSVRMLPTQLLRICCPDFCVTLSQMPRTGARLKVDVKQLRVMAEKIRNEKKPK